MVRLRREIDGLDWDPAKEPPDYFGVPLIRDWLDRPAVEMAEHLIAAGPKRILSVGAPIDPLISWAQRGLQIQAVEPDPVRAQSLRRQILDHGLMRHLSVVEKRYGMAAFEASSFDLALLFDEVNRVAIPGNIVRKCARELKMGASMLVRFSGCDVAIANPRGAVRVSGKLEGARQWAISKLGQWTGGDTQDSWSVPLEPFLEELATIVRIDETRQLPKTFSMTARGLANVPRNLLPRALRIGQAFTEVMAETAVNRQLPVANIVCVSASKSLGFGKVFRAKSANDELG